MRINKVFYIASFDIADEIDIRKVALKLKTIKADVGAQGSVLLPAEERDDKKVYCRVYRSGIISIIIEIPSPEDILLDDYTLSKYFRESLEYLEQVARKIAPFSSGYTPDKLFYGYEDYVIIYINGDPKEILANKENVRKIASILRGEKDIYYLSEKEIKNILCYRFDYYDEETVIIDRYGAVIISTDVDIFGYILLFEMVIAEKVLLESYSKEFDNMLRTFKKIILGEKKMSRVGVKKLMNLGYDMINEIENFPHSIQATGEPFLQELYKLITERLGLPALYDDVYDSYDLLRELYVDYSSLVLERKMLTVEYLIILFMIIEIILYIMDMLVL